MECEIWQVAASYRQKPYRKTMMEVWGATVHSSPSELTEFGRSLLAEDPDHPGSLGIAISEAVDVRRRPERPLRPRLGAQPRAAAPDDHRRGGAAAAGEGRRDPDVLVGCTGGGSNFGGLAFPFLREKLAGKMNPTIRCVEPAACPTLTKGEYRYDFGDTAGMTPLMKMHTLGHDFIPEPIHAGGLRYHGMSPLVSHVSTRVWSRRSPSRSASASPGRCSSPAPRASSRRPSRPTRSPRRSARPWRARSPARRR
jgi:tryptophan synthase beta chain